MAPKKPKVKYSNKLFNHSYIIIILKMFFEHIIKFFIILYRPTINRHIFPLLYTFVCFLKRAPPGRTLENPAAVDYAHQNWFIPHSM